MKFLVVLVVVCCLVQVMAEDKDDEDIDVVIGPANQVVLKTKDKKGKGDTLVISRRRRHVIHVK